MLKSCGCEIGRYCRECINTPESAAPEAAAAVYVEKSMSTKAKLGLGFIGAFLLLMVTCALSPHESASVPCPAEVVIDGKKYGGCTSVYRQAYFEGCMKWPSQ